MSLPAGLLCLEHLVHVADGEVVGLARLQVVPLAQHVADLLDGRRDVLGGAGEPSFRTTAEEIARANPDVIVVMPCGYNTARTVLEFSFDSLPGEWEQMPALRKRRIFAVDAKSYFSRPGPRLADGVALLAHLFHPELVQLELPADAFKRISGSSNAH